jgi:hypothetical protein
MIVYLYFKDKNNCEFFFKCKMFLKKHMRKIMMTDQFECAFVTGFRDKTRRICHIYAIHYN